MKYKIYKKGDKEFAKKEIKLFDKKIEYKLRHYHYVENGVRNLLLYLSSFLIYLIYFSIVDFHFHPSLIILIIVFIPQVIIFFDNFGKNESFLNIKVKYNPKMNKDLVYIIDDIIREKKIKKAEKAKEKKRRKEEKERKRKEKLQTIKLQEIYVNDRWLSSDEIKKYRKNEIRKEKFKKII